MASDAIKSMQLYPRPERIYADLTAAGYESGPVSVAVLNQYDQLHYHGVDAVEAAITACGIKAGHQVLEIGAGWGGCARYVAQASGAGVTAIELQKDYNRVAMDLTARAGLADKVLHMQADFLNVDLPEGSFDQAVSWLALFHIPDRPRYLAKIAHSLRPGGRLFAEDLYARADVPIDEMADFQAHLFPNSLVSEAQYQQSLTDADFDIEMLDDMTDDWGAFTATRLQAFRENRDSYQAIHGAQAYDTIETFYTKMAGYFERGLVGGVRFAAKTKT